MVKFVGTISRQRVNELYGKARAGLLVYQPAGNHMEAQPNKLFEYMAAGLPIIASNFPLWNEIIEDAHCGLSVDPTNPNEVKEACLFLLNHPDRGTVMGANGRRKVTEYYNWEVEEKKLIELYKSL